MSTPTGKNPNRLRETESDAHLIIPPAIMRQRERANWHRRIGRIGILIVLMVGVCALPIAYYFVGGWQPRSETHSQLASIVMKPTAPPAPTRLPILAQDDEAERPNANQLAARAKPPRAARSSERLAMVKPDDPSIEAPSQKPAVRVLDADAVRLLMKQGEQLVEVGDFAAARTLFQRAAEADDAAAAVALGATYDPSALAGMRAVGIDADVVKARFWYQRAVSLGSPDAKRRLELLANR
jgi:TPR repeat protein